MTQFVRGALTRARRASSKIIFVTCDPRTELQMFVDLTIAPAVGPEVIAGSTRLKAGTATKIVLNMLTTASMIRIGKTYGNLMVDVQMGSEKLRDRARRIITIVTGLEYDDADKLLKRAQWNVKAAIVMQKTGLPYLKAMSRLRKSHDSMRQALGEDIEPRLRGMLQGHAEAASINDSGHGKPHASRNNVETADAAASRARRPSADEAQKDASRRPSGRA
jgi:N-acetylmuramic acid 6-phosphate etherase